MMDNHMKIQFYYAVQTQDTANNRISDVKKVYIGFNIGNTTPSGVSFKEEDGTAITNKITLILQKMMTKN